MKRAALLFLAAIMVQPAPSPYKPADEGSSVEFKIKNLGIGVSGTLAGLSGIILFDPAHPADAAFDVSIDANTVNTGSDMRDEHLRAETYFDVKAYPRIRFVSTRVTASTKKDVLFVFGKLAIKGQTKDINFPFTASAVADGYLFEGSFTMNRREFGVGGASIISDNLEVKLHVLARK